jgi:hypothetical protein
MKGKLENDIKFDTSLCKKWGKGASIADYKITIPSYSSLEINEGEKTIKVIELEPSKAS